MTCTAGTCGVGGWGGPLPGDPSNDSVLSATPVFGGIEVSWNLPTTNAHAVAFVKLWRSLTGDFAAATLRADATGTVFFDRIDTPTRYYYWIQVVSRNGTIGELIGPASAIAKPTITAMIEQLTGEIDAGLLAQTLKTKLDEIELLRNDLQSEVFDRETGLTSLAQAIADAQAGIAEAHTFILDETSNRTSQNSAIVEQLTGVAATLDSEIAAVQTLLQANIDSVSGDVSALQTTQVAVQGQLNTIAGTQTTQQASINTINGTISTMQSTQTGFQTSLNGYAGVQTTLSTNLNTLTGTVNAMYTAKVDVNGLIGGFGLSNNGTTVEAGFDVDKFWVGRTTNKVKPFIISGGIVYISQAAIPVLSANKIDGRDLEVMSGAYSSWAWPSNGAGGGFYLGPSGLLLGNRNEGQWVRITSSGNIDMPGFQVIDGVALFTGTGNLNDGSVGGIQVNGTDIRSTNWSGAGGNGFIAQSNGNFWINNLYARGDIEAQSLKANTVMVQTAHIAGQAVTIPVGAFSAGIDTDDGVTQSVTLTSTGAPIRIDSGCSVTYGGSPSANGTLIWELRRVKAGVTTTLMSGSLSYEGNSLSTSTKPFSTPPYRDVPGTGSVTYQLWVNQAATSLYNRGMFAIELKR